MPDDRTRVDPTALARLAQSVLDGTIAFGDELGRARASLAVPSEAFGTAGTRGYASSVLETVAGAFEAVADVLMAVYEVDADKLYQAAFAYQKVDEEGARRISSVVPPGRGRLA